ncbi:hypothetical protein JCM15519_21640 [Fundidesulfovibrio butyratiphilus]
MAITRSMLFCLFVLLFAPSFVHCKLNSAENHVKEFYQFYIRSGTKITIDSDLSSYVDGCTLRTLRIMYNRACFDSDYFTRSQDVAEDWLDVLVIHKEMKVNDTTSVVPISFRWSEDKQHHLLVFVKKEVDGWRIIKVSGTERFYQ